MPQIFTSQIFQSALHKYSLKILILILGSVLCSETAAAKPNGTWLSKPQIWYHTSTDTLDQELAQIRAEQYEVVFLDFRNVTDTIQQQVSQQAREQGLTPVVWIQTPQYRSLTVQQLINEARHGDGIQIDDHFFTHYSLEDFYRLRKQYTKRIYCSIQPFQAKKVPPTGCNELDVQCYVPNTIKDCLKLVDRLQAVASLSSNNTLSYLRQLNGRPFNVFLWPNSDKQY